MGFAAQLHNLAGQDEEDKQVGAPSLSQAGKEAAAAPAASALSVLPARPASSLLAKRSVGAPLARVGAAMATAAAHDGHGHDDHGHGHHLLNPNARVHPFHVIPYTWWPAMGGWGAMQSVLGMTLWFHAYDYGTALMLTGMVSTALTALSWWRDCIIESDMGMHTEVVKKNLVSGMWLFIASEAMLFVGLLWSCVHYGISPNVTIQMQWPPVGVHPVGWDKRALVMSAVLAASYYSANVAMVATQHKHVMAALAVTLGFGVMFLADQYVEYSSLPFTITDSTYGTTFFITTGFHGMHVLLGAIYLATVMGMYARTKMVGVGMKQAVLYWHFVDIVWIFVYGIIYAGQY